MIKTSLSSFILTSCGAVCYARKPPSYTIEFNNAILNSFISNNTNVNIRLSIYCKNVKKM